jgi:hypothetical protein
MQARVHTHAYVHGWMDGRTDGQTSSFQSYISFPLHMKE